jgi:hypothetical protein
LDQRVELAAGKQLIESAQAKQDALHHFAIHPLVINNEQIGSGTI